MLKLMGKKIFTNFYAQKFCISKPMLVVEEFLFVGLI